MTLFAMVLPFASHFRGIFCPKRVRALGLSVALGGLALAMTSGPAPAAPDTTLGEQAAERKAVGNGVAPGDAETDKQRFAEGVAAYDAGDYARAYDIWLPLAQGGDLAAQRNVGHLLRRGRGVTQDLLRARSFYEQAGRHGLISAQLNVAFMYLNGEAAKADPATAAFWFHKAAEAGASIAEYNLALMYESGRGVGADMPRALGWYARAAQNGHDLALKRLSELVAELPGPPNPAADLSAVAPPEPLQAAPIAPVLATPDLATPVAELAVPKSELPAHTTPPASRRDETLDETASNKTPEAPPNETDTLSRSPQGSDITSGVRQLVSPDQGKLFMEGKSRYQAGDYEGAAKIWGSLAQGGVAEAQYRYGQLLAEGHGVERDMAAAYTWFRLAAAAGHISADRAANSLQARLSRDALDAARQAEADFRATMSN